MWLWLCFRRPQDTNRIMRTLCSLLCQRMGLKSLQCLLYTWFCTQSSCARFVTGQLKKAFCKIALHSLFNDYNGVFAAVALGIEKQPREDTYSRRLQVNSMRLANQISNLSAQPSPANSVASDDCTGFVTTLTQPLQGTSSGCGSNLSLLESAMLRLSIAEPVCGERRKTGPQVLHSRSSVVITSIESTRRSEKGNAGSAPWVLHNDPRVRDDERRTNTTRM